MAIGTMVVATACDGDDAPSVDPEADQELVDASVLTIDDLPGGFESVPPDDSDEDGAADVCLEEELDLTTEEFEDARTARTDPVQFEDAAMSLRVRVNAFEGVDIPGEVMDAFDGDDFLACLGDAFEDDPDIRERGVDLIGIDALTPLVGDEATAFYVQLRFSFDGIDAESRMSALLVDRFVVSVEASGLEGALDEAVIADALETMATRIEAAN